MDGQSGAPPSIVDAVESNKKNERPPVDPAAWTAEFDGLVGEVETTARDWGVRPESLEARFVKALLGTTRYLGRLAVLTQATSEANSRRQRDEALLDVTRAREVTRAASLAVTQARNAQIALQVEQENLVVRMIDKVFPLFADRMQKVLVVRERRINATAMWQRYAIVALATLGLFLGGYVVRLNQDSVATELLDRCLVQPVQSGGAFWCDISNVVPQQSPPKPAK